MDRETFCQYVREALTHYHDPARLQTHALTRLMLPVGEPEGTRAQALRKSLLMAINALRPEESLPYGEPAWWPHRALWLRYIEGREVADICAELAIGRTSFYEQHNAGLQAVTDILWRQYAQRDRAEARAAAHPGSEEAIRREIGQMVQTPPAEAISLGEVWQSTLDTVAPLTRRHAIRTTLSAPPDLPLLLADPAILRQVFINLLAEVNALIAPAPCAEDSPPRELTVQVACVANALRCQVDICPVPDGAGEACAAALTASSGLRISQSLLASLGGQLDLQARVPDRLTITLIFPPPREHVVLIVDNDPDTVQLYRRYLQAEAYTVRAATSSQTARRVMGEQVPDLILLDLLMPQEDGWKLLQEIKQNRETARVPVVVCSVLEQPQLALALGAADVLNKPIDRASLLRAVRANLPH